MFLVCHVTLSVETPHVSQHNGKFGDHRPCGSGDIFLVREDHDSTYCLNLSLPFISKGHDLKVYNISY